MKRKDSQTERGRREGRKSDREKRRSSRDNDDLATTRHPGSMRVLLRKLRKRWRDE